VCGCAAQHAVVPAVWQRPLRQPGRWPQGRGSHRPCQECSGSCLDSSSRLCCVRAQLEGAPAKGAVRQVGGAQCLALACMRMHNQCSSVPYNAVACSPVQHSEVRRSQQAAQGSAGQAVSQQANGQRLTLLKSIAAGAWCWTARSWRLCVGVWARSRRSVSCTPLKPSRCVDC
jgi:hypothetical protein